MAQAREVLGETISASLRGCFARDHEFRTEHASAIAAAPALRFAAVGRGAGINPGHDPGRVPSVPRGEVEVRRDADGDQDARIYFTYKVEAGYPPHAQLRVPRNWLSTVAAPDWVALDGFPILQIRDHAPDGRPRAVLVAVIGGHFDPQMHGWRGDGHTHHATVSWQDATPHVEVGGYLA